MAIEPVGHVEVTGLRVSARDAFGATRAIVDDVSFTIARGEVAALIGESGSGKTTIALSLMGHARSGCRISADRLRVAGTDVLALSRRELADLRGRKVCYIAQSAAAAFNPARRIMAQVIEGALIHRLMGRAEAEAKAVALFQALALPDPEHVGARFPHQVSGGQLQRLLAAMALITDPDLLILDEPTTALDVTTQIEVLRAFKRVVRERQVTALYVSHDLAVVAQIADRIIVLRHGRMQEAAGTARLIAAPAHKYTASLLAAARPTPRAGPNLTAAATPRPPVLEVAGLIAGYGPRRPSGVPLVPVLHGIDLRIPTGSAFGVLGESGCGKSTLARVIAGILPAARGSLRLAGEALPAAIASRTREQLRRIQIVFQMPDTALNPARSVARIIGRPLAFYHELSGAALRRRTAELLDLVHLTADLAERYPGELSGGQKQRVSLARALAAEPSLILCDEVTSALDTVVGAAILDLLAELRRKLGLSYLFISHDLATVRALCDQVMVLYAGARVESGSRETLLRRPLHPYSELLLSSVPELRPGWLDGVPPTPPAAATEPSERAIATVGCPFFPRCTLALPDVCNREPPPLRNLSKGAEIACHRTEDELLALQSAPAPTPSPQPLIVESTS
jgi:peptide/nickel transport system ATP-binding protein